MARRYCGDLRIYVTYRDCGDYKCSVQGTLNAGSQWEERVGKIGSLGPPASGFGEGVAYDSPEAYDQVAHAAVSFAVDAVVALDSLASINELGEGWAIVRAKKQGS